MEAKLLIVVTIISLFLLTSCTPSELTPSEPTLSDLVSNPSKHVNKEMTIKGFLGHHVEVGFGSGGAEARIFIVPTEAETELIYPIGDEAYSYGFPLFKNGEFIECYESPARELSCDEDIDDDHYTIRGILRKGENIQRTGGDGYYFEVINMVKTNSLY